MLCVFLFIYWRLRGIRHKAGDRGAEKGGGGRVTSRAASRNINIRLTCEARSLPSPAWARRLTGLVTVPFAMPGADRSPRLVISGKSVCFIGWGANARLILAKSLSEFRRRIKGILTSAYILTSRQPRSLHHGKRTPGTRYIYPFINMGLDAHEIDNWRLVTTSMLPFPRIVIYSYNS